MIKVNVHDAKTHLSTYLEQVEQGDTVVICRRNVPIAELHKIPGDSESEPRPLGLAKQLYGDFSLPESFFEPLPDELIDRFEVGK